MAALLLLSLGLHLGLVFLVVVVKSMPIPAPDISKCAPPSYILAQEHVVTCCPPWSPQLAVPYTLPPVTTLKVRRAAHRLDDAYVLKLVKAYDLMKALPEEDPRSFTHQARIHCAYCNEIYSQGNTTIPFQVHGTWLFFPFHRWYLYFHERILASLLNDTTFALPYWGYDRSEGSSIPEAFIKHETLSDIYRDKSHKPPAAVNILGGVFGFNLTREEQVSDNEYQLFRAVVSGAREASLFMGMPYHFGDAPLTGYGTVEVRPHNTVHVWTGDSTTASHKDMGAFFSSGNDPVFYAHHAFLDRLWIIWTSLHPHQGFNDADFLDTEFTFYDENARLVTVKVRDSLIEENMGYKYETVGNPWLTVKLKRASTDIVRGVGPGYVQCKLGEGITMETKSCTMMVSRDPAVEYERVEEVLVVQNPVHYDYGLFVFINYPDADARTTQSNILEFVGTNNIKYTFDAEAFPNGVRTQHLGIGFHIKELGLSQYRDVAITIVAVPVNGSTANITSLSILDIWIEHRPIFPPMEIMNVDTDLSYA